MPCFGDGIRMRYILVCLLLLPPLANPGRAAEPPGSGVVWPTGGPAAVVREYLAPPRPWQAGHRGVDLLVQPGQAVVSPISGVVVVAGVIVDRPVVVVQSGRVRVSLEPVAPIVDLGAVLAAGDVLGVVADGAGHCPPRRCLHWGLRVDDDYHDPLLLVRRYRAVLLPRASAHAEARGSLRTDGQRGGRAATSERYRRASAVADVLSRRPGTSR